MARVARLLAQVRSPIKLAEKSRQSNGTMLNFSVPPDQQHTGVMHGGDGQLGHPNTPQRLSSPLQGVAHG